MTDPLRVIFVSNDIVPGCGLPVAAPGLRVHGLADGMRSRGHEVTTIVMRGPLERQWNGTVPPPMPPDTIALRAGELKQFLRTCPPSVVVITNANQIDNIPDDAGHRLIIDFFAPKLLELVYRDGPDAPYPAQELSEVRARKLRGIRRADGFVVNGRKKMPYFLAWILQSDHDIRTLPFEHAGMCLPAAFTDAPAPDDDRPLRFAMAGYLQGWSVPGEWLRALTPPLHAGACTLDAMLPDHWSGKDPAESPELARLLAEHALTPHGAMAFDDYQALIAGCDVVLDLFDRTRERELAVVTRTISALCCGKPVVHPPFTEVSPLIEEFDAGWLIDPADDDAVRDTLARILTDRAAVAEKARNARRLWAAHLDPTVATAGLEQVALAIAPQEPVGA